jgi:CBS domain-containing protein
LSGRVNARKRALTAQQLGWCDRERPVATINENERAVDAFVEMHRRGIGAVAIVNSEGHVKSAITASDLKRMSEWGIRELCKPVGEYSKIARKGRGIVHLTPKDTLEEYMYALKQDRIHQVFVVSSGEAVGIVLLTDVIRACL